MLKITPDKWKHFYAGLLLGIIVYCGIYYLFQLRQTTIIAISLGIIVTISYVFELFSKATSKGHYEVMDAVASIIGGGIGIALPFFILS